MRAACLLAIACTLLTFTNAEELEETRPQVQASSTWPIDPWAQTDWGVGFLTGAYQPLQAKANGYDCQSRFLNFGVNLTGLARYFNKPFTPKAAVGWFGFALAMSNWILSTYGLVARCAGEFKFMQKVPWYLSYDFLEAFDELGGPVVGQIPGVTYAEETYTWSGELLTAYQIILRGISLWLNFNSQYNYYFMGKQIGSMITYLFVQIDHWAGTGAIRASARQERYLFQV